MSKLVSLAKRRGFVFPGSEIYGGFGNSWDYGPLGFLLKENIKAAWLRAMVQERDDILPIETAIIMNPRVWVASGHVAGFHDPLVDCKSCKQRFRADQVSGDRCPECGGELTEPRQFNLMFKTYVGPVEEEAAIAYLRPETAQGMFVDFKAIVDTMRVKLPFGIAQIGKSFRNEITPGNFIFRTREFEQMEMEYFVRPGTDMEWFDYWVRERYEWYVRYGIRPENLRLRQHEPSELAHYSRCTTDIEYRYPFGWGELEGIANRGDFDLRVHEEHSGEQLRYFDEETREHVRPYVIEPAAGATRSLLAFLLDAYDEERIRDEGGKEDVRTVLHLHPALAPYKAAVLPLLRNRPPLVELARTVYARLRRHYYVTYDETGAIGRRYRRQDEIGTPYCLTIDYQSLEDQTVTVRDRDSMEQVRVHLEELVPWLSSHITA
ncbi:MAG TPA: glycine--tRNA ligase [Chloroflexota bacterium]|nr:glycine--tRNA ligase [Chloroflexota bacterium]